MLMSLCQIISDVGVVSNAWRFKSSGAPRHKGPTCIRSRWLFKCKMAYDDAVDEQEASRARKGSAAQ